MKLLLSFVMICVTFLYGVDVAQATSNEDYALLIANKLEAKVVTQTDVQKKNFYQMIIDVLEPHKDKHPVIPMVQDLMRDEIAQLGKIQLSSEYSIPHVDLQAVQDAWFGWVNDFRAKKGLAPYTYSSDLQATAKDWSNSLSIKFAGLGRSAPQGGTHWRNSVNEGYYNSEVIGAWFADRGVTRRVGESVGYRGYSCSKDDCTATMIASLRKVFDMYMAEGTNGAHYKMLAASYYGQMGFGLTVEDNYKVWAVFHIAENK